MIKSALQYLVSLAGPKTFEVDGRTWASQKLEPVVYEAPRLHPNPIKLGSLNALANMIRIEMDDYELRKKYIPFPLFIRIEDPVTISVFTRLDDREDREKLYLVKQEDVNFAEGWREPQKAIIELRSRFIPNEGREYLLNLLAKIKNSKEVEMKDTGVSQEVVVTQGISLLGKETVKPIVPLMPFRTFREVNQPQSDFIFRIGDDGRVGLFEADGGIWKMEAKDNIAEFLCNALSAQIVSGKIVILS